MMKKASQRGRRRKCQTMPKAKLRRPRRMPRSEPPGAPASPGRVCPRNDAPHKAPKL